MPLRVGQATGNPTPTPERDEMGGEMGVGLGRAKEEVVVINECHNYP